MIPDAFGIYNRDGTIRANPQTVGFAPIDSAILGKVKLIQPVFKVIPRLKPGFFLAAFGFCLVAAQKNMPADIFQPDFLNFFS